MSYKVIGGIGTRRRVAFACPVCGAELEAPLSDAGRVYPCPTCSRELVVPGADVLQQEAASAAALAEQHRPASAARSEPLPFAIPEPDGPSKAQPAQQLDYSHGGRTSGNEVAGPLAPPAYRQIVTAARAVIVFAYLAFALGCFGLVVAGAVYLMGVTRGAFDRAAATTLALGLLPSSLILLCAGSLLYLFAHVSLAVRDIARNSFRQ